MLVRSHVLAISAEYIDGKRPADFGIPAIGNKVANVPIERIINEPSDNVTNRSLNFGYNVEHRFNPNWKIKCQVCRKCRQSPQLCQSVWRSLYSPGDSFLAILSNSSNAKANSFTIAIESPGTQFQARNYPRIIDSTNRRDVVFSVSRICTLNSR